MFDLLSSGACFVAYIFIGLCLIVAIAGWRKSKTKSSNPYDYVYSIVNSQSGNYGEVNVSSDEEGKKFCAHLNSYNYLGIWATHTTGSKVVSWQKVK